MSDPRALHFFLFQVPRLNQLALLLFGAGFGTRVSTLSLVTVWAGENIRARVFGLIQIIENLGKLCAEPFLMKVFAASLELPEYWLGLPFFTTAVS